MQLTKLILKNFRSHKSLTLDFKEGVTAILGGNGTGKSSIVEAIIFLLTGEGYAKVKTDMLTVGEVSGYVVGHWIIDDKEAILERHLDSSKVAFKYAGVVYKKSTEVNEIWDRLFQIDKNIVQNVIVSNQGEISLLFNGDSSTKEKLFQKIFMVPNTTRLRDTIWNSYIKTAPPEYPVKNREELLNDRQLLEQLILMTREELSTLDSKNLRKNYEAASSRKLVVEKVIQDHKIAEGLCATLGTREKELLELEQKKSRLEQNLASIAYDDVLKAIAQMDVLEDQLRQKKSVELDISRLIKPDTLVTIEELNALGAEIAYEENQLKEKRAKAAELTHKLAAYEEKGLSMETTTCPTCGSELKDTAQIISHIQVERDQLVVEGAALKAALQNKKAEKEAKQLEYAAIEKYQKSLDALNLKLETFSQIEYQEEDHQLYRKIVSKYRQDQSLLAGLNLAANQKKQDISDIRLSQASVSSYDGAHPQGAEKELEELQTKLDLFEKDTAQIKKLEIEIAVKQQELKTLLETVSENDRYLENNRLRSEYTSVLNGVYELFHTTRFPRALIQTYSSTVTEYMNEVLASFDFPYTAKVNDSFGIDIYNENDLKLPSVSGGQQVMVGFSLRLALHNMFVGAFPFMIVDEGSYGLNAENSRKYFEIISKLNKTSKFKQVIVIDHHPELSEYVDNTINL